ncbi:hypothetical protein PIROE2DRAFT_59195 [Piromyces sp. E2]|nr:hypothetical protein PIROE2DRAFT_59195 [Piromyces sp. E2]|eukprot:OUM66762.1 hypothetical protein PIROE2DRAFT_59195 [Piromyces sp. E2]
MSTDFYSPAIIKTHYLAFKEFLESQDNDSKRQRGAKEKLIKLTNQQFQELSTDVYDELIRRTYNSRDSDCLQSQSEFQPKRNEARAKLAALSQPRFRDLSQDIYNEIQRRFPNIITEIENENKGDFNNNLSPVNGNADAPKSMQSPFIPNQHIMPEQQTPNQKINFAPLDDSEEVDLEVAELRKANINLKSKLDSLTKKYSTEKDRLEKELESVQETLTNRVKINEENATEYSKLYNNYTQLQNEIKTLRSQIEVTEKITDELRQENDNQIEKVNELTKKNEKLENENKSLKEENEKTPKKEPEEPPKEEVKEPEPAPVEATPAPPAPAEDNLPDVPVKDCINPERFNNYKEAVNELLAASKSKNPADVLVAMKSIVITCKNITEESDEYERLNENTFTFEEQEKIIEIKENLSIALTHLMNVTKNHATHYPDVSPSFIESATSDLSVTIVSLVRTLKEHQNRILGSKGPTQQLPPPPQQQLPPINPKTMNMGEYTPNNEQVYDVHELKLFLEEKTDLIVQGIQSLLQKIQQPNATNEEFSKSIAYITDIVDNVIGASQNTISSQAGIHLYDSGEQILQNLKRGNYHLKEMSASMSQISEQEIKNLKSSLASASYEIAVYVRDLLQLLD